MACEYCHGEPPSSDGRTKCGWCVDCDGKAQRRHDIDDVRQDADRPDRGEL